VILSLRRPDGRAGDDYGGAQGGCGGETDDVAGENLGEKDAGHRHVGRGNAPGDDFHAEAPRSAKTVKQRQRQAEIAAPVSHASLHMQQ
jgi:hypothetical protein